MAPIVELHRNWRYNIVGGGMTPVDVAYWLRVAGVPPSINIVYDSRVSYTQAANKTYPTDVRPWPIPNDYFTFLLVNGTYVNPQPNGNFAGMTWGAGSGPSGTPVHISSKATILVWPNENVLNKACRIWHEMCHACQVDVDNFYPYQRSFNNNGIPNPNTEYYNFRAWAQKRSALMANDQFREWINTGYVTTSYIENGKLAYTMRSNYAFEIPVVAMAFYTYMWNKYGLPWY